MIRMGICQVCKEFSEMLSLITIKKRGKARYVCKDCYEKIEKENAELENK